MTTKKDLIDLKPGCYVLDADVTNPRPDKRVSRNWTCAPVWKKGMRLYVRAFKDTIEGHGSVTILSIEGVDERWTHMNVQRFQNDGDRWNALAAHMTPVPENLDYLLHRCDVDNSMRDILRVLLKWNKISLSSIEAAHETAMEEAQAEWEASQKNKEK